MNSTMKNVRREKFEQFMIICRIETKKLSIALLVSWKNQIGLLQQHSDRFLFTTPEKKKNNNNRKKKTINNRTIK